MKLIWQSITLIISFIAIFIWQNSPLKNYTVELLGLMVALYLIIAAKKKGRGFLTMGGEGVLGIFLLNSLIFLLIFSTGGLNSALFFILYFLCFGIAFVFNPLTIFVFIIGSVVLFWPEAMSADVTANLLKIGSLVLVSPLAYFFGREYKKTDEQDEKINAIKERTKEAADTISEDIDEVIADEKSALKAADLDKLNDILEETEDLRSESKD